MARIRTVKPEAFTHEELFDSEKATGLPLRLAYIGLWTACDREGRFLWRPRQLKTDILPYDDDIDFSRVLDALWTRGFLVKYASDGNTYGCIPSWSRHQFINNREKVSDIPEPTTQTIIDIQQSDVSLTRERRVLDACSTRLSPSPSLYSSPSSSLEILLKEFEEQFWPAYPNKVGKGDARNSFVKARRKVDLQTVLDGLSAYVLKQDDRPWCNPATWLNQERWSDKPAAIGPPQPQLSRTQHAINKLREKNGSVEFSEPELRNGSGELSVVKLPATGTVTRSLRGPADNTLHREAEDIAAEDGEPIRRIARES